MTQIIWIIIYVTPRLPLETSRVPLRETKKKLGECGGLCVNLWFWFDQRLNLHLCFFFSFQTWTKSQSYVFVKKSLVPIHREKLKINFFVLVQFNINLNPRVSFRVYQNVVWSKFISGLRRWTVWVMDSHHSLFLPESWGTNRNNFKKEVSFQLTICCQTNMSKS